MEELFSPDEKIGEFLVRIGALTQKQVEEILKIQKDSPERLFGEIAIELGYINDDAIDQYLKAKGLK